MRRKIEVEKVIQLRGHKAAIYTLFAKDERHFLSGAGDGWVVEWDLDNPDPGRLIAKVDSNIFSLHYLADTAQLAVGNMNGGLHWVNLADIENPHNIAHHRKGLFSMLELNGQLLTAGGSGLLSRWSIQTGRPLESYQLSNDSLRCLSYNAPRDEIAVGASDNNIYFLDARTLEIRQVLHQAHDNSVFSLAYTADGSHLLSGGRDAHLKAWDLEHNYERVFSQPAHWFTINHIAFQPSGQLFATASRDKSIKIWDASNFDLLKVIDRTKLDGHLNSVNRLLWMQDGELLLSTGDDRSVCIWKIHQ
ncbi:MAG: WD40 repeat domain-containing protein [Bacteroidota bacterium]